MAAIDYHDIYNWHPGDSPESEGPVRNAGLAVVHLLHGLHERAAEMSASKHVTEEGAKKILEPLQKRVIAEAARYRGTVSAAAAELAADEKRLFSPPVAEPGNLDEEIRRKYDALEPGPREELEAKMKIGEHRDVMLALARSPFPGRAKTFGASVYRAEIEKTKPARVSALESRRRGLAWLGAILDTAPRAAAMDISSQRPVETPIEKITRARLSMKQHHTA